MTEKIRKIEKVYKRISGPLENILFPLALLLWPLVKVAQGIDVSDSTYSLGNYLFFDRLDGMWVISTFLSNAFGALIVRLPGAKTLLVANIYFGLIVSATALIVYYSFRKELTAIVMFVGEFIAIGFCWIPAGIMYNYLTYLLFSVGAILIYFGVKGDSKWLLGLAGFTLGLNVFVRIPNLTEMALIVAVWVGIALSRRATYDKRAIKCDVLKRTGICVLGYIVGVLVPLIIIVAMYGIDGISDMIIGLASISAGDNTYTIGAMISATVKAYLRSVKWIGIILAVIFMGTIMMAAVKSHRMLKNIARMVYLGVLALMIRFFWGRGMFSFRYYEDYTSMFEWGMVMLYMAWLCALVVLISKRYNVLLKTYATICIVVLLITPLGSNNFTCQNLNNMFLVMPFVLYIVGGWIYHGAHRFRLEDTLYGCNFPWMCTCIVLFVVTTIQVCGFHMRFVFRDGMDGTARDAVIYNVDAISIRGMHTTDKNAENLTGLCEYMSVSPASSAVFWGDCPGLAYVLELPSSISTTWPDLDSYPIDSFNSELMELAISDDAEDSIVIWRKLDNPSGNNGDVKQDILLDYISTKKLDSLYENDEYIVYGR